MLELKEEYGSKLFKTITADNGSEFSGLGKVHSEVYYAHPYSPWQCGSNENNNGFLRRVITKGRAISSFSEEEIYYANDIMNEYPRRIFKGLLAEEVFHAHFVLSDNKPYPSPKSSSSSSPSNML
ncbi:IS30 family transposase [Ligilactobacillus agilis]|uniref:IS30 family transposase n=1 Tax=Ligilactobacillus agilis TaxID=1601 RepID=UPI003F894448